MLASGGAEGAAPVEIASLMRAVGLPPDGRYLVAAMCAQADRVAGPDTDRWRYELAEELALPLAEGTLVGPLGGATPDVFAARMREARPAVEADRSRVRLSVGVSAPATGVVALSGALHEASSAPRRCCNRP